MEIKYLKRAARLLKRYYVNGEALDLSKDVLWVSVGQMVVVLPATKVECLKKILLFGLARASRVRTRQSGQIFFA